MVCTTIIIYMVILILKTILAPPQCTSAARHSVRGTRAHCTYMRHRPNDAAGHRGVPLLTRRCFAAIIISALQQEGLAQTPPCIACCSAAVAPVQNSDDSIECQGTPFVSNIMPRPRLHSIARDIVAQVHWVNIGAFDSTRGYPGEGPARDIRIGTVNTTSGGSLTRALRAKGFDDFPYFVYKSITLTRK